MMCTICMLSSFKKDREISSWEVGIRKSSVYRIIFIYNT